MADSLKQDMADQYPRSDFKVKWADVPCSSGTKADKWKASVMAGVLFAVIASPFLYKLVAGLLKPIFGDREIVDMNGCPTMIGLALHAVVFTLIVRFLMR